MADKKQPPARLANTFGVLGYVSLCFQWLWASVALLPILMENHTFRALVVPEQATPQRAAPMVDTAFSFPLFLMAIAITLVVLTVSVVLLVKLPMSITKVGKKTVHATAHAVVPLVTHGKKLPAKKRRLLTFRWVKIIKFALCIVPVLLVFGSTLFATSQIGDELLVLASACFAIATLFWFSLQYLVARQQKIPGERLL